MEQLRAELVAAFEAARARWPNVPLPLEQFAARIDELAVGSVDLELRATDLFLSTACAAGDPAALRYFESVFLSQVPGYVARFDLPTDVVDDICQKVRMKVLVGQSPGISRYRGRAPLAAWVHVTAVRLAIDVAALPHQPDADVDFLELVALDEGPEIEAARNLYRERFRATLEDSLIALSARDKTILRFHVVEGLNVDAIGAIYGVHRATAARWLVAIRARIFEKLKEEFALRWKASSSEFRSLVSLLQDQIHITAKRVLGPSA